jgi:hypothetical protein
MRAITNLAAHLRLERLRLFLLLKCAYVALALGNIVDITLGEVATGLRAASARMSAVMSQPTACSRPLSCVSRSSVLGSIPRSAASNSVCVTGRWRPSCSAPLPAQWPGGPPSRLREFPGVTAIRKCDGHDATSKPSVVYVAAVDPSLDDAAVLPTALVW